MARMLPAQCLRGTSSEAERRIFDHIRSETPDSWVALHSLGLTRHRRKPWAEADFVVVTPNGIFVLEVKGGAVGGLVGSGGRTTRELDAEPIRSGGRGGRRTVPGPPRLRCLQSEDRWSGTASASRSVIFNVDGTDLAGDLVYDARDVEQAIRALHRPSQRNIGSSGWPTGCLGSTQNRWADRDVRAVIDRLAGDFDLIPSLRADIGEVAREHVRLTEAQLVTFRGSRRTLACRHPRLRGHRQDADGDSRRRTTGDARDRMCW